MDFIYFAKKILEDSQLLKIWKTGFLLIIYLPPIYLIYIYVCVCICIYIHIYIYVAYISYIRENVYKDKKLFTQSIETKEK